MTLRRAAFVDRDGVINDLVADPQSGVPESPLHPGQVRLMEGAAGALARLADDGFTLVGVSNQPAAAKGTIPLAEVLAVQDRVLALLAEEGVVFSDFRLCLHHPDAVLLELRGPCDCRKPAPGMLQDAAAAEKLALERSWMIGDTDADVAAGRAAGCATILVTHPGSVHKRDGTAEPDEVAPDLTGATELIIRAGHYPQTR